MNNAANITSSPWRPTFRITAILITTCVVAVWFGVFRIVPHIAIAALGILLPILFTTILLRIRKRSQYWKPRPFERAVIDLVRVLNVGSWVFGYVVSIGPVIGFANYMGVSPGNGFLEVVYTPVIWLHSFKPLSQPIEDYCLAWGFH